MFGHNGDMVTVDPHAPAAPYLGKLVDAHLGQTEVHLTLGSNPRLATLRGEGLEARDLPSLVSGTPAG